MSLTDSFKFKQKKLLRLIQIKLKMFRTFIAAALAATVYSASLRSFAAEDIDTEVEWRNNGWERRAAERTQNGQASGQEDNKGWARRAEAWGAQQLRYDEMEMEAVEAELEEEIDVDVEWRNSGWERRAAERTQNGQASGWEDNKGWARRAEAWGAQQLRFEEIDD